MLRFRSVISVFSVLAGGVVAPLPAAAQVVVGRVTEEAGAPVEGAFVVLLDETGRRRVGWLTPPSGEFVLRAPGPGRYRLLVERIGYRSVEDDAFALAVGDTLVRDLSTSAEAVSLEGLTARSERRCQTSPAGGARTADLWEEARKALSVAAWADEEKLLSFEAVTFERRLSPPRLQVVEETTRERRGLGRHPFRSLPAEVLAENGFVREEGEVRAYYAPDAGVLLSDVFLSTHCFGVVVEEGRVGLSFEPVPGRDLPEVRGVLWIEPRAALLERLEYRYVGLPEPAVWTDGRPVRDAFGGEVWFERLASGAWIVSRWAIRMPVVEVTPAFAPGRVSTPEVVALREVGGVVTEVLLPGRTVHAPERRGTVTGVVWDSSRHVPLAGADVSLRGTARRGRSSADGSFRIHGVLPGEYDLIFEHPRLASLGLAPPSRPVRVDPGRASLADAGIPSLATLLSDACDAMGQRFDEAAVVGSVLDRETGEPAPGARVEVRWFRFESRPAAAGSERRLTVRADQAGRFQVCRVPADVRVTASATADEREAPPAALGLLEAGDVGEVVLEVGILQHLRLEGRLVDDASGSPLAGARIWLGDRARPEVSGVDGTFALEDVVPGEHELRVRHPGYGTATASFTVERGDGTVELRLSPLSVRVVTGGDGVLRR